MAARQSDIGANAHHTRSGRSSSRRGVPASSPGPRAPRRLHPRRASAAVPLTDSRGGRGELVVVAARVLFSGRRFGAIADIGESGAATAIRRAMLLCSLLGSVVRFLLVIPRQGRHFWAAARAQLVTKSSGWAACCYAQSRAPTPTRSVYLLPVRWRSPPKKDSRWPCTPPRSAPPTVSGARRGRSCS